MNARRVGAVLLIVLAVSAVVVPWPPLVLQAVVLVLALLHGVAVVARRRSLASADGFSGAPARVPSHSGVGQE
ncbi:MAG: hypothetical protein QM803_08995 [Rhodocyclaceae bacterium]